MIFICMHVTIESSALTKDAVCGLRIPNKLLYLWYRDRTVGRQLIKALNEAILDKCMAVREDCNRVSERLRTQYCALASKYNCAKSWKRPSVLKKAYVLYILEGESVSVQDDITTLVEDFERVTLYVPEWKKN